MKETSQARFLLPALVLLSGPISAQELAYQMVEIPRHGIKVPHLARYRDPAVLKSVNRQIDEAVAEVGCSDDPAVRDKTLEVRSDVRFTGADIFSVYISASYFCGLYPENDDNRSLTFDLRTGRAAAFEGLFREYEKDKARILKTIFSDQVAAAERAKAQGKEESDSCEDSPSLFALDHLEGSTYLFNFTPRGLEVQPDWPHVIEACAERVTVPYERLREFAVPGGLLERVLPRKSTAAAPTPPQPPGRR